MSTIKITSPGNNNDIQPLIQKAADSAINGDTIELPEGQFVVNKSITVKKFVSIKGQGKDKTILYRSESTPDNTLSNDSSWRGIIRYVTNSLISSGVIISDLTVRSKKPSLVNGDGLSLAADIGIEMVNCIDFVITRCKIENFGNGGVSIYHDDEKASGLIHNNEFNHNCKGYTALGLGYGVVIYGANKKWINDPKFGSSNFIFVENNTFDYHRHSIAAGGCALYVFRHNTVKNNIAGNTAHAIDGHEARLEGVDNYYSTRAFEVYNNTIINTMFKDGTGNVANGTSIVAGKNPSWLVECAIRPRGGEALIYGNYIEGYRFGIGVVNANATSSSTYPTPYQSGYDSAIKYGANHTGFDGDKGAGDVFIWGNNYKTYAVGNSQCVEFYNYTPSNLKLSRDYHMVAKPNYTGYTYPHPLSKTDIIVVVPPIDKLTISASSINTSCFEANDGIASVIVNGGIASAYTYNWNTVPVQTKAIATNLSAGTYSVIVKDGVSSAITSVVVGKPSQLNLSTEINLSIDGGVAPYFCEISNQQNEIVKLQLDSGIYTIAIKDKNGCSKKLSIRIK